jgi:hypothetical protein
MTSIGPIPEQLERYIVPCFGVPPSASRVAKPSVAVLCCRTTPYFSACVPYIPWEMVLQYDAGQSV